MHDAQAGFVAAARLARVATPARSAPHGGGDVICHNDLFPPNVIFRDGLPVALDRLGLRRPGIAPLRRRVGGELLGAARAPTTQRRAFGPRRPAAGRRGCASSATRYGLDAADRGELLDVVAHRNRMGYEIHRLYGGELRLPGWREMWDAGSGDEILERSAWFEAHRAELQRSLA